MISSRSPDADSTTWEMPCPPIAKFLSPEDAQRAINAFARNHGYAVVVQHTYYDKNRNRRRLVYGCDRHGEKKATKTRPGAKRRHNTSTRRCGCSMKINVVRENDLSTWTIDIRGSETTHNHPPSVIPSSHPIHRRSDRDSSSIEAIATDAELGIRADRTLARLRVERPDTSITSRDIYNERQRSVASKLGVRTRIQHLVHLLRGPEYRSAVQQDADGCVTHLFFAFREILKIFAANHDVLIMDCTYKTNGFGMPLLNIIGVSGMNSTLHVAQVFLRGEAEPDYVWALSQLKAMLDELGVPDPNVFIVDRDLALLNALQRLFPRVPVLLCIWRIIKDVDKHSRMHSFPQEIDPVKSSPRTPKWRDSTEHRAFCDGFVSLLNSSSEEEYEKRRSQLHELSRTEAEYIDDVWLDIWKHRIVQCWTNKVTHYGIQTTSRVEGYHSTLKTWITSSSNDLLTLHTRLVHWWKLSIQKARTALSDAQVKTKTLLRRPIFALVLRVIHDHALLMCLENLDRFSDANCTGEYSRVMGLPCSHKLRKIQHESGTLKPSDFDAHWWIDRTQAPPPVAEIVLEPRRIEDLRAQRLKSRRAARHAKSRGRGRRSSARILSGFKLSKTCGSAANESTILVGERYVPTSSAVPSSLSQTLPELPTAISRGSRNPKRLPLMKFHPSM